MSVKAKPRPEPKAAPTGRKRSLTREQMAEVCKLYEARFTPREIAERFGVHRDTIQNYLKRAGVVSHRARRAKDPFEP